MLDEYTEIERLIIKHAEIITPVVQMNAEDGIKVVFAGLYMRIINSYQAVTLLVQWGYLIEALSIMRSSLEARVVMSALLEDGQSDLVIEKLHNQNIFNLEKVLETSEKWLNIKTDQPVKAEWSKKSSIFSYACLYGEHGKLTYASEYSTLCNLVHINKGSINMMLGSTEGKKVMTNSIDDHVFTPRYNMFLSNVIITLIQAFQLHHIRHESDLNELCDKVCKLIGESG